MGCFYVDVYFRPINDRGKVSLVPHMLVDAGSEATWVPRKVLEGLGVQIEKKDRSYMMANGQRITRSVGYALIEVTPEFQTVDEVVFAEDGDMALLGARTMEGLNVRVDPLGKHLVAAGPMPAAGRIEIEERN